MLSKKCKGYFTASEKANHNQRHQKDEKPIREFTTNMLTSSKTYDCEMVADELGSRH